MIRSTFHAEGTDYSFQREAQNKLAMTVLFLWALLVAFIVILPARIVDFLLPFYYGEVSDGLTTLLLVIMLAISMFLLWRYLQHMQRKTIHKETETHELRNDPYRNPRQRWAPDS